jgi:HEAT repeat protein
LTHADSGVAEACALSLGESRLPEAVSALIGALDRRMEAPVRRTLLFSLALTRDATAIDFLIEQVRSGSIETACAAIGALGTLKDDVRVRERTESAAALRDEPELGAALRALR